MIPLKHLEPAERGILLEKKQSRLFLSFFAYAVIGWCYEVFLEVWVYRWGFSNRGVLFGSYCPVYGFGALLLLACLWSVKEQKKWYSPLLVFLGTMVLATTLELLTSYLLEATIGHWPWDYAKYRIQFQGRIALHPSIRFGLGGLLFLYGIQPVLHKMYEKLGEKRCGALAAMLLALLCMDFAAAVVQLLL